VIEGNLDNLRAAGATLDQEAVARLERSWRKALAEAVPMLERRRRSGKVRNCHGDLHLGNICLIDDKPTLFDAIEFSAELTRIDVLYDLAFLLMDLIHRELGFFANLVLNRYLDLTRDEDGMAALPLFLSLRAAIRSHVSVAAGARQRNAERKRRDGDSARSYLALGETLLARGRPRLVAIGGRSGSGKSTLAQALAPDLAPLPGARVLRSDVLRKAMLNLPPEAKLPRSAYTNAMSRRVYSRLLRDAARIVGAGYSVVLDATFLDPDERDAAARLAAQADVPFAGLWLDTRPEVMAARLAARRRDASDATVAVLKRQIESDPGSIAWPRIDSGAALPRVVAEVRRAAGVAAPRLTARANSPRMNERRSTRKGLR
jgi:uncharacterized protein